MGKEIQIVKIGEETKVSFNLKTLSWIIGIILFIFSSILTVGYFDIKREQKMIKDQYEKEKEMIKGELSNLLKEELHILKSKDEKFMEDISEIKGDIKVLLDRSRRSVSPTTEMIINSSPTSESLPDIF